MEICNYSISTVAICYLLPDVKFYLFSTSLYSKKRNFREFYNLAREIIYTN